MSNLLRLMSAHGNIESSTPIISTAHKNNMTEAANKWKIKSQCDNFRVRINNDAKAAMSGDWDKVKKPYKPKDVRDGNNPQWRTEMQRQKKMDAWMEAAQKRSKATGSLEESRYQVIMEMRNDSGFATLAKKIPEPAKPESMKTPEPTPAPLPPRSLPVTLPIPKASPPNGPSASLKRKAPSGNTEVKQEVIDVDQDDEEPELEAEQSDYEPENDAAAKREERANKRKRTGDFTTQLKQSAHEEDLEFQLEESRLKAQLQEVQIRRKMAALKRRNEVAK